jgi:hypothetical protein
MSYQIDGKTFRVGYEASYYSGKDRRWFKALVMPQWRPGMVSVRYEHQGVAHNVIAPVDCVNPLH